MARKRRKAIMRTLLAAAERHFSRFRWSGRNQCSNGRVDLTGQHPRTVLCSTCRLHSTNEQSRKSSAWRLSKRPRTLVGVSAYCSVSSPSVDSYRRRAGADHAVAATCDRVPLPEAHRARSYASPRGSVTQCRGPSPSLGGLPRNEARGRIERTLGALPDFRVVVFEPRGAPEHAYGRRAK